MPSRPETTRLSSKGQVVLPGSIRNAHHWETGAEFLVQDTPEGVLLKPLLQQKNTRIEDVTGCLKATRRVSQAEMDAAVAVQDAREYHAPNLEVRVEYDAESGHYWCHCPDIGLITEEKTFEQLVARARAIGPDIATEYGFAISPDDLTFIYRQAA
jgi:bifunctional DNA-binding transcriptional regulator/antitoxin component of YhaV-PrlF toxin-antitoxin module